MSRQNVLAVEVDAQTFNGLASVLKRINFDVDRLPTATGALELVSSVPFDAVIVNYPLRKMPLEEFLAAAKKEGSASREAAVALVASEPDSEQALAYLDTGIDLVIANESAAAEKERQLCRLLGILPRKAARLLVRCAVALVDSKQDRFVAQTRDLSASGMFIATNKLYPVGSRAQLEFSLPNEAAPIVVEIEVMRHAQPARDGMRGMGVRFVGFSEGSEERLRTALDALAW